MADGVVTRMLVVARDGADLVVSLLGPEREALDLDGSVVRLPPG